MAGKHEAPIPNPGPALRAPSARATGPALEAAYQFALWLAPTVEKFPRAQKFTLGDRMLAAAYDVVELLIEATYARARRALLAEANLKLQKLRIFCRMARHRSGAAGRFAFHVSAG